MQLDLLTVSDVAEILGVGPAMVRKLDKNGILPASTRTKRGYRLYQREPVEKLAKQRAANPPRRGPTAKARAK